MDELMRILGLDEVYLHEENRFRVLEEFAFRISGCTKCPLSSYRTQVVVGGGNPYAPAMIVGEAPGRDEDLRGIPFVGRAGKLLTQLMEEVGLDREKDFYIANVIKCRPPKNRDPLPSEINSCSPYLDFQVGVVSPKVILCLGRFSMFYVTGYPTTTKVSNIRGKVLKSRYGIPAVVTYHPAAALRNPSFASLIKEDLRLVKENFLSG